MFGTVQAFPKVSQHSPREVQCLLAMMAQAPLSYFTSVAKPSQHLLKLGLAIQFLASKTRLKGVSVARRNSLSVADIVKPPESTSSIYLWGNVARVLR